MDTGTPNQDVLATRHIGSWSVYTILDGHGPQGEDVASRASTELIRTVELFADTSSGGERAVRAAFAAAAEAVDSEAAAAASGATATLILHDRLAGKLHVGHVGDSLAFAARRRRACGLTDAHRPTGTEELRVRRAGGLVRGGYLCGEESDKMISVTRALGDLDVRMLGVVATPEVSTMSAENVDFLVIATDGLWDAHGGVSGQRAVRVVYECVDAGRGPDEAVEKLMDVACGKFARPIDDTTVLVVILREGSR